MRKLHLTLKKKLPEITSQDQEFAERIAKEFNLSLDEISWLVRDVRNEIQTGGIATTLREDSESLKLYELLLDQLFAPGVEINEVRFTTNRGTVRIKSSDPFFEYFHPDLYRIRKKVEENLQSEDRFIDLIAKYDYHEKIYLYIRENTCLNKNRKLLAIGKFLAHFQMYGYKPIRQENEFTDKCGAIDYNHYLVDIVKRRLNNLLSEYPL